MQAEVNVIPLAQPPINIYRYSSHYQALSCNTFYLHVRLLLKKVILSIIYTTSEFFLNSGIDAKDVISRNSPDGIANKLKNNLHFDVKAYAKKSDMEMFNAMKLYKYLFENKTTYGKRNILSVIENAQFKNMTISDTEHYNKVIDDFRAVVSDYEMREKTMNWIHECWTYLVYGISPVVIEDSCFNTNSLQRTYIKLKQLLNSFEIFRQAEEPILETFYNLLISTNIVQKIEVLDDISSNYENNIPPEITELVFTDLFSEQHTFNEFFRHIDIENLDEISHKIWSFIMYNPDLKIEDILKFKDKKYKRAYNFAMEQAEQTAILWLKKDKIRITEWCIIIRELLDIYYNDVSYQNRTTGHTNTKLMLRTAIKNKISGLPQTILIKRLSNRNLLLFGKTELFQLKKNVHDILRKIERTIFKCRSLNDMTEMHGYLYFMTSIAFVSEFDYLFFYNRKFIRLFNNISFTNNEGFEKLLYTFQRDYACNPKYKRESESAFKLLAEKLNKEIRRIESYSFTKEYFLTDIITLPVFFGYQNNYYIYVQFKYYPKTRTIEVNPINMNIKNNRNPSYTFYLL